MVQIQNTIHALKQAMANLKLANLNMSKKKKALIAASALFCFLWIASELYSFLSGPPKPPPPGTIQAQTIRVKEAQMDESVDTVGNLIAVQEAKIKATAGGKIQVKSGTLLVTIVGGPEVRAPFDGYISDWLVKPGEFVQPGNDLIDLVNAETLLLTYRIPETFANKLDVGQTAEIKVRAFPEQTFKGVVNYIAPYVDKKTLSILVKAEIANPNQDLWPGMAAHVKHILRVEPAALVIPDAALVLELEGYRAYVIKDGKVEKRKISLGSRQDGRVHVLSGLQLNEPVIMTITDDIKEGMDATAVDWTGNW